MSPGALRIREAGSGNLDALLELFESSFPRELEISGFDREAVRRQLRLYRGASAGSPSSSSTWAERPWPRPP